MITAWKEKSGQQAVNFPEKVYIKSEEKSVAGEHYGLKDKKLVPGGKIIGS